MTPTLFGRRSVSHIRCFNRVVLLNGLLKNNLTRENSWV